VLLRLRVTYHRPQDLVADSDQQFSHGGLLVRVDPPSDLEPFARVELQIRAPQGNVSLPAQVLQFLPGAGLAVGFDAASVPALVELLGRARAAGQQSGRPPEHGVVADNPDETQGESETAPPPRPHSGIRRPTASQLQDVHTRLKNATQHEKMQIALLGNREERGVIIRDPTAKNLHQYVLKNPKVQLDEVTAMAGLRTVAPECLKFIASRREWAQRPEVAAALVRNPKTPAPLAIKLVPFLSQSELRQLAKGSRLRAPIQKAVRKKVMG